MNQCMYIKNPTLFNTGILSNSSEERLLQGLRPQMVSNSCVIRLDSPNSTLLHPFPVVPYDVPNAVPNNCDCTRWIQPP